MLASKMSESTGASVRLRLTESVCGARCDILTSVEGRKDMQLLALLL